ncbi:MAG: DNA adenine methylase [Phycisphaeraceae bacterium]|nr:DNA adenine methylase [Phycisphaeraceae bacterium]
MPTANTPKVPSRKRGIDPAVLELSRRVAKSGPTPTKRPGRLGSLLPYYGSKRRLAPKIVHQLGEHRAYYELCAGSMALLLAKPRARPEIVVDLYGAIVNLARVVASPRWCDLRRKAARTLIHESVFKAAVQREREMLDPETGLWPVAPSSEAREITDAHVDAAYLTLLLGWQGRSGVAGRPNSHSFGVHWSPGASNPWPNVARSIRFWHQRLAGVEILQRDAILVAERIPDKPGVAVYCDPPYIVEGGQYHHAFTREQHEGLAAALTSKRHARVVVSYFDHPWLDELYPRERGWIKHPVPQTNTLGGSSPGLRKAVLPEVLLINGPLIE